MSEERLTEQEVNNVLNAFDFLSFSSGYRDTYYGYNPNATGYFTPDLINQQMQNINMNPVETTVDNIINALKNPKTNEEILREYSMALELQNMYYKRLLHYLSDMPCFNITFDCVNIEKDSEYTSKNFKNDLKVIDDFLNRFDAKEEFKTVLRQILRQGVYYCVFRDDGIKYTLQELPANFCKITGRHAYGILFDFDMQYFISQAGVDINMFPNVFKRMLRSVYRQNEKDYDPAQKVDKRHSSFIYWRQCNPADGFWAFKTNPELATLLPYFAPLFPEVALVPVVRKLQEDKYFIAASKMLVGILGFNKDTKSGQTANQINITPEVLGKFLGVARQGLSRQIGLTALPVDKVEKVEFDTDQQNLETAQTETIAKQSVAESSVLFHQDKLSVHESKLAAAVDANIVKTMYPMFANFIEYFVNRRTKHYKFKFEFHDVDIPDDKEARKAMVKDNASIGIVDFQDVARMCNMNVFQLKRRLHLSKSMGFDKEISDLLIPNLHFGQQKLGGNTGLSTSSINNGKVGRPSKPNSDNENTIASYERSSNEIKEL